LRRSLHDALSDGPTHGVTSRQTPYTSKIRDLVQAFVPDDGQPAFGRLVHIDSNQSVMPRTVSAVAGPIAAQCSEGGR
jgi:hypothetical protein